MTRQRVDTCGLSKSKYWKYKKHANLKPSLWVFSGFHFGDLDATQSLPKAPPRAGAPAPSSWSAWCGHDDPVPCRVKSVKHLATKGINHWLWKEWKGQVSQVQHCAILWMSALCTLRLVEAGLDPDSMLPDTWLRWIRFDYCFVLCVAEREILFMWLKWCVFTIFSLDRHSADAENVLNCSQECVTRQVRALQCKDRSSLLTYASAGDGSPHFDLVTLTAQECIMRSRCWFGYGLACARRFVSLVPAQPLSVILRSRAEGNSIAPQV